MAPQIKRLTRRDTHLLANVAPGVFDEPIDAAALARFLADPHHHIVVAIDDGAVVGFVSALHYNHPDKALPELWINEIGVAPTHVRRGLARAVLDAMFAHARTLGCAEAWVLTDRDNTAALALYAACGGDAPSDHVMIEFRLDAARGDD